MNPKIHEKVLELCKKIWEAQHAALTSYTEVAGPVHALVMAMEVDALNTRTMGVVNRCVNTGEEDTAIKLLEGLLEVFKDLEQNSASIAAAAVLHTGNEHVVAKC